MNKKLMTSSRKVAEMMGSRHDVLIKKIEALEMKIGRAKVDMSEYFIKSIYKVEGNNKNYKEYLVSLKGIKYIIDNTSKTKSLVNLILFYNKHSKTKDSYILIDRFEMSFKEKLERTFAPMNINIEVQKPCCGYRIDFYLPEFKLAIEYDEFQHKYNMDKDIKREEEIKKSLGCEFIRLNYETDDNTNIGVILNKLFRERNNE